MLSLLTLLKENPNNNVHISVTSSYKILRLHSLHRTDDEPNSFRNDVVNVDHNEIQRPNMGRPRKLRSLKIASRKLFDLYSVTRRTVTEEIST